MSNLVEQWKQLNRRHNQINKWYGEVYGGPDVSEKDFAERAPSIAAKSRELATELDKIMAAKTGLESQMTFAEFEQTLNRNLEGKSKTKLQRYLATSNPHFIDVDEADRQRFLEMAAEVNNKTIEEIRQLLANGDEVRFGNEWSSLLRYDIPEQEKPEQEAKMVKCNCGHTVESVLVMSASRGTTCLDCYDKMSN